MLELFMFTKGASGFGHAEQDRSTVIGLPVITRHEEAIRRGAILALIYLFPAMWILHPVLIDPDIWWHLQTGKWIVEHGTLPATDPFSVYGEGKPWVAYSWLFEVGMFGVVSVFGESGIILYTLVVVWLIMLVLHRIIATRCHNFVVVSGLLVTSVVCLTKMFTPRPWLLTILFCSLTLQVVLSLREGKTSRWFWCLPLFYVLWANIHIQFIYGLGLLGLACVAPLVDRYVSPFIDSHPVMAWGSPQWKKLIGLTALCAFATLVTPYHVRLYSIVADLSAQTGMWEYAQEMQAPPFRSIADWSMLALFSLTLVQLGRRIPWSSFELVLVLAASVSAFRGQRDVWFLVLGSLTVLAPLKLRETKERWSIAPRGWLVPIALSVVFCVICILEYQGFSESRIHENTEKLYPIKAATFVEEQGYTGPLYNHFDWGGYLIWRLPHLKVSMDGRANVHGDERIRQAIGTWTGRSRWVDDPDLNGAEVVIAQKDIALAALLHIDPRFHVAYEDETAVVFVRASRNAGQSNIPTVESPLPPSTVADVASAQ
jgi:hypothetical protein